MEEARGVSPRNKRIVKDYYARTQSRQGALVRAQRMEQTILPTLHGRTRTAAPSCARAFVRMYKCVRMRSYSSGRDSRVTYVTFASVGRVCYSVCVLCVCVRASLTPTRSMYGCRQPQSRGYFAEGSSSVQVESWGLLVLSTLRIPQLLSFLSFFALSSLPRLGSKAKASPLLHLRRERPCNSNERPSLFPFILVPVSGER